ncbi:MAG: Mur ligase family protein, partial [Woeseiaceae bacterium]
PARVRIVNLDSEFGTELAARCSGDVITVSTRFDRVANGRPHVFVRSVVARQQGSEIGLQTSWGEARVFVPLVGDFNVANSVLVLAYLLSYDIELADACAALEAVNAPPGRMQRVDAPAGPTVFIDYAHTPNALEVALRALRLHTQGRLHVVFGCGGDRDTGKRPLMARIAERLADRVVITSDNPRFESPARIIDDIVDGLARPHAATVIEDRAAAIAWAIANAAGEDEVLIAGKGHENYQIIGDERIAFSDYGAAFGNLATEATE